jgi:hypothetical protein
MGCGIVRVTSSHASAFPMVGVRAGAEVWRFPRLAFSLGPCINEPRSHRPPIYSEKRDTHDWRCYASWYLLYSGLGDARSVSARRENNSDRRVVTRSTRKVAALEAGARSPTLGASFVSRPAIVLGSSPTLKSPYFRVASKLRVIQSNQLIR